MPLQQVHKSTFVIIKICSLWFCIYKLRSIFVSTNSIIFIKTKPYVKKEIKIHTLIQAGLDMAIYFCFTSYNYSVALNAI